MRKAGAAARAVLVQAAARRLVPRRCGTDLGQPPAPDGQRLSYGELAEVAAALSPPADPTLKDLAEVPFWPPDTAARHG
ncbi:MAG: hypothetical protein R3D84_15010 [Paracoccaceae bacterium]